MFENELIDGVNYICTEENKILAYANDDFIGNDIEIVDGTTAIKVQAFQYSEKVESVSFPESLEKIEEQAFEECINLKGVCIKNNVVLEQCVFVNCYNLENLDVACISIPEHAFVRCGSKTENGLNIILRNTEKIEFGAFADCYINELNLPKKLHEICNRAFYNTKFNNPILRLPEGLQMLGNEVFDNSNLTDVYLPESIQYVERQSSPNIKFHLPRFRYKIIKEKVIDTPNEYLLDTFVPDDTIDELLTGTSFKQLNGKRLDYEKQNKIR